MPVLKVYPSPRGFHIIPIHWSHDPVKRTDPDWLEQEQAKYARPEEWLKEMEIDFRSKAGLPAYPNFESSIHLVKGLSYIPILPLCLICDFNVAPHMVWEVAQIHKGKPRFIDEVTIKSPATVDAAVDEFRNRYPAHKAELWIYGDAAGHARTSQTGKSDYALLRLALAGYSAASIRMKVPKANPSVKDRLNAVNRMLRGAHGLPGVEIDEEKCPELVRDMGEVVLRPDGNEILKIYDPTDPYSERTHGSDGMGYFIAREWAVASETSRESEHKAAEPMKYGQLLGDIR